MDVFQARGPQIALTLDPTLPGTDIADSHWIRFRGCKCRFETKNDDSMTLKTLFLGISGSGGVNRLNKPFLILNCN